MNAPHTATTASGNATPSATLTVQPHQATAASAQSSRTKRSARLAARIPPRVCLRVGSGSFRIAAAVELGDPGCMSEHTVEEPAVKRLERSRSDRMLAGVCGGLASYFEIHPAFYRVGFVVLTLLGGAGLVIYAAAALVMPEEGKPDSIVTAALRDRRDRPWPLIGLGLLAVAGAVLLSHATLWPHGDAWFVLLLAGAAILLITRH